MKTKKCPLRDMVYPCDKCMDLYYKERKMLRIKEKEFVPVTDWKQLYIGKEVYIKGTVKQMTINETCTNFYMIVDLPPNSKPLPKQFPIDPDYIFIEEEDKDD